MERTVPVLERRPLREAVFQLLRRRLTGSDQQRTAEASELGRELVRSGISYNFAAKMLAETIGELAREVQELNLADAAPGLTTTMAEVLAAYGPEPSGQPDRRNGQPASEPDQTEANPEESAMDVARRMEDLARANAELEDIAYVVSHDLKEPLRGIEAFSTFLAEDHSEHLDDEGKRYVQIVRRNAARMKELIDDLLELSRIGRMEPNFEPVDVGSVVAEVREGLEFTLREKAVDLRIQPGLPTITGDPVRLKEVFHNLLSNAAKFNDKPQPIVEISYSRDGGQHVFTVRDNGIGIDEGHRDQIFKLFQRLNRREDYEGTGAGLAICKKIVEAHGGRIWVDSEPGTGSTFSFTIPQSLKPLEPTEVEEQDE